MTTRIAALLRLAFLAMLCASSGAAAQDAPKSSGGRQYALLLAISDYPGSSKDLDGSPLNDVALMRDLLIKRFDFADDRILTLSDGQVSRVRVIEAVRRHLGQAGPDDVVVLYYSGHGIQVDAKRGLSGRMDREPDSLDEALLLLNDGGTRATYLLDDELGILLDELRARRTVVILDACHSRTATRAVAEGIVEWSAFGRVPLPPLPVLSTVTGTLFTAKRVVRSDVDFEIEEPDKLLTESGVPGRRDHLVLAAARDDETALSGPFRMADGKVRSLGVFTLALFEVVQVAKPTSTIEAVVSAVQRAVAPVALRIQGTTQTPMVSGRWKSETLRGVLGSKAVKP